MSSLASPRVASAVVDFSWRQQRETAFLLPYAPILGDLMERFPESAKPFLDDLLTPATTGQPMPPLTETEAQTVCRILIDMPDIGPWKKAAQQILPRYRGPAEKLLNQDINSPDRETSYRAQVWLRDLRPETPAPPLRQDSPRRTRQPALLPGPDSAPDNTRPTLARRPLAPPPEPYDGPKSGTLECNGTPVPENAEYVFRNLPLVNLQLDYDTKIWEARLSPGEHQTQRLVLRNKANGPQKRCVVHWTVLP